MTGKSLRIIRIVLQVSVMVVLTGLLLATPAAAVLACRDGLMHWMLMPLAMGGVLLTVVFWICVTLIFGRVYCSVMCPVGTLQDIASRLRPRSMTRPRRYEEGAPRYVRLGMIALLVVTAALGTAAAQWALMPFVQVSPVDSYELMVETITPPHDGSLHPGWRLMIASAVNFVFIVGMGLFRGRTICNTLCPLGGALGSLSTLSMLQIDINTDECTHCRRCEDVCKAFCINSSAGTVDASRCVACFDCLAACPDKAIRYTTRRHKLSIPMLQSVKPSATTMTNPAVTRQHKITNQQ